MQIYITLNDELGGGVKSIYDISAVLFSLLREEIIFCDEMSECFSRKRSETMFSYSEFFSK